MEPPLPPRPAHPLGRHDPRVPDRAAMDAVFFVLRTGCQRNALSATGICPSSSAHRRFQEWAGAGVFETSWREGLLAYDAVAGIDWAWLALDGTMGEAPLGGGEEPAATRPGQAGDQALAADGRARRPARRRRGRRRPERPRADARDAGGHPGRAAGPDA